MKEIDKIMLSAISEAKKTPNNELPIGAIIVNINSKKIIASAYNSCELLFDPTEHAEIRAIKKALKYIKEKFLNDYMIFTTLEPCLMCYGAILETRLSRVIYAAQASHKVEMSDILYLIENNSKYRDYTVPQIIGRILEKEAEKILLKRFNYIRKNKL